MKRIKIVIFCGYRIRELDALLLLKQALEQHLSAEVYILGGLSELQKMYYYLHAIQPDVVFISQVLEKACRKLALYTLNAGALLYVVPAEITVITIIEDLLLNPKVSYDQLITKYLIPGRRYQQLLTHTDVKHSKIKIVGSPKIDCLVQEAGGQFLSRDQFCEKYDLDQTKKNIFIFTSFVMANPQYLKADSCFDATYSKMMESNRCIVQTKARYVHVIEALVKELPEYNFILKPHPLEDPQPFEAIAQRNFRLVTQVPFYACVNSIDLAIHWSSTVCPECWIKDIPTLQFAPFKKYDSFLSECHPGNPVLRTKQQLKQAIQKYLWVPQEEHYKKFQQEYLQNNFYKLDGQSVIRIAQEVSHDCRLRSSQSNFTARYSWLVVVVLGLERSIGVPLTQWLMSIVLPGYDAKNAIENQVYID